MKNNFIFLFFLFGSLVGFSQSYRTTTYQEEQNLISNFTKSIVQDKNGFIWIGSDQGLWRFDGIHFKVFNDQALPNIKSFYLRKGGQLLVVHDKGISEIIFRRDSILFQPILRANLAGSNSIIYPKSVFEDSRNSLWISEPTGIVRYKDGKIKRYNFDRKNATTSFLRSFVVEECSPGQLIVASQQGFLYYYEPARDVFVEIPIPRKSDFISALMPMGDGKIWIGASDGIQELKLGKQYNILSFKTISKEVSNISCLAHGKANEILIGTWNSGLFLLKYQFDKAAISKVDLNFKSINTLFLNDKHQFLISSDDGIAVINKNNFRKINLPSTRTFIQSLTKGSAAEIYATDGSNLFELQKTNDSIRVQLLTQAQKEDFLSIAADSNMLWIGTNTGKIYQLKDKKIKKTIDLGKDNLGTSIFFLHADTRHNLWLCHDRDDVIRISPDFQVKRYTKPQGILSNILSIKGDKKGNIYCAGIGRSSYLFKYNPNSDLFENISIPAQDIHDDNFAVNDLCIDKNGLIWLGSNQGLFSYDGKIVKKHLLINAQDNFEIGLVSAITLAQDSGLWLGTNIGMIKYYNQGKYIIFDKISGLPSKTIIFRNIVADKNWGLLAGTTNGLAYSDLAFKEEKTPKPNFLSLKVNAKKISYREDSIYTFKDYSYFEAEMVSLIFPNDKVAYKYRLVGKNNNWSAPGFASTITIPQLRTGRYTLEIKALNQGGFYWSPPVQFKFNIEKSAYQTWWAILLYLMLFGGTIYLVVRLYTAHLVKEKVTLENIVRQRTAEISGQKEEILGQKEEIMLQKDKLEEKTNKLALAYQDIQDSIHYAKTIQEAMLQNITAVDQYLKDFFILFKPRDVISGDFYWFAQKEGKIIIAAIDCTGHGVPGALMSMVGNTVLNQVVNEKGITAPDKILDGLNKGIRLALKQDETSSRDGMDVALCVIDKEHNTLEFSGAHNPLYYIQNNVFNTIKADNFSIGGGAKKSTLTFTKHSIDLSVPTVLYLFSDGYQDQLGGPEKIKFMRKPFQDILFQIHQKPMREQKEMLESTIDQWIGGDDQTDDILIIGIKI